MQQIEIQLKKWRESRNIKTFPTTIKDDMLKEVEEVRLAIRNNDIENYVEELADVAIFAFNGLGLMNLEYKTKKSFIEASLNQIEFYINNILLDNKVQTYEILCKVISLCDELVTAKKYDFKKVLNEKIKLLNSRRQSVKQKENWNKHGANGKWQKDPYQEKNTLYVMNLSRCKLI